MKWTNIVKGRIVFLIVPVIFMLLGLSQNANASPQAEAVQVKGIDEARALAFLQRAYFSLEQALYYADKSRNAKVLPSFDFERFMADVELIRKDLGVYLYPRNEKLSGEALPFKIDGDYFLNDIINAK